MIKDARFVARLKQGGGFFVGLGNHDTAFFKGAATCMERIGNIRQRHIRIGAQVAGKAIRICLERFLVAA